LQLYHDGVVAETRHSTGESDNLLNDVLDFMVKSYGLRFEDTMIRKKSYSSEIILSSDIALDSISPKFAKFFDLLQNFVPDVPDFRTCGIHFASEADSSQSGSIFRLERQVKQPFSSNRYYSQAPVRTEVHIVLVEALEEILESR